MLRALGARFMDAEGRELANGGGQLVRLADADLSGVDPRLASTRLVAAVDVYNPLLGTDGAAAVFGPQKGANPRQIAHLESGLARLARVMEDRLGLRVAHMPGSGAAGGTGFAALCLGAHVQSGIQFVLDETGIAQQLHSACLVIVGEGSLDRQSLRGKAPIAIARLARRYRVPAVAVAGRIQLDEATMAEAGFVAAYALVDDAKDEQDSMNRASELLRSIGAHLALRTIDARDGRTHL
jgi:glycerate 2-kinase